MLHAFGGFLFFGTEIQLTARSQFINIQVIITMVMLCSNCYIQKKKLRQNETYIHMFFHNDELCLRMH